MTNELKKAIETIKAYLDLDSDIDNEYLNAQRTIIQAIEQQPSEDKGEISDGYHTFNQLYHQRAILFATIVNQNKDKAWKSFKHSDGHYCFDEGGEMFIVGIDTPKGSYTYHYHKKYWDYFDCKELECGKVWDGHTEEDVTRLLSLEQQPSEDCISREEALLALTGMDLPTDRDKLIALFTERIQHLPSVTSQRPKGKWIEVLEYRNEFGSAWHYECSECRAKSYKGFKPLERYCPNCGAKMEGEE